MQNEKSASKSFKRPIVKGAFIILAALCIAYGLNIIGTKNARYIAVKGVSEREVIANSASWRISFDVSGKSIPAINSKIQDQYIKIRNYFHKYGFKDDQVSLISGYLQNSVNGNNEPNTLTASSSVNIYTDNIQDMQAAAKNIFELYSQNISISTYAMPTYTFTRLNDLKPEMISEAIKNAKISAEKFVKNSDSSLGKVKNVNQGYFVFLPFDGSNEPHDTYYKKILRVVVSASYYLN